MRSAAIIFFLLSLLVERTHSQNDYAEYARGESIVVLDLQPEECTVFCSIAVSYHCYVTLLSYDASVW